MQIEVQKEPAMALDGGKDGLAFYRAIAQKWLGPLKPGGVAAVEIGNGQGPAVAALFEQNGVSRLSYCQDLTGEDGWLREIKTFVCKFIVFIAFSKGISYNKYNCKP